MVLIREFSQEKYYTIKQFLSVETAYFLSSNSQEQISWKDIICQYQGIQKPTHVFLTFFFQYETQITEAYISSYSWQKWTLDSNNDVTEFSER